MDGQGTMGKVEEFRLPMHRFSQSPRKIWVYLPDSYDETDQYYPVLYMFDGHNLFFDDLSTYGQSWKIKDYLDEKKLDLIVVGQDCNHIGDRRNDEYCPYPAIRTREAENIRPRGKATAEWFVNVLKPEIERRYRACSEREHVGIAGSSMGGLMAEYVITAYSDVFSKAACISPATFLCMKHLCKLIEETQMNPDTRIYIDQGSEESRTRNFLAKNIDIMLTVNHLWQEKGCNTFPNLVMYGDHSEASWANIMPMVIGYMFPELF